MVNVTGSYKHRRTPHKSKGGTTKGEKRPCYHETRVEWDEIIGYGQGGGRTCEAFNRQYKFKLYDLMVKLGTVLEPGSSRKVHHYEVKIATKFLSLHVHATEFDVKISPNS